MPSSKFKSFVRELAADFKWGQFFVVLCLMGLSLLSVYSATWQPGGGFSPKVIDQVKWFAVGIGIYFFCALMDYRWFCRKAWILYLFILFFLFWVKDHGKKINGARRWLNFEGITFQPAEFAKISLLLLLCYYLSRARNMLNEWRSLALVGVLTLVPAWLINKEPDLGTALVVTSLALMLLFLAGAPKRFWIGLGTVVLLGLGVVTYDTWRYDHFLKSHVKTTQGAASTQFKSISRLKPYQLNRIIGVVDPDQLDPLGQRWNADQALIAIGSGGLYGKGFLKGEVTHGGYLPSMGALNDFIFSVFAEENGFVGGAMLLALYTVILLGGIRIALKARDDLGALVGAGVTFLLFFHVLVNMGMTMGIFPIVGVPLPLMSYGGSFVIVCMACLGLLQSVWLHRKPY